MGNVCCRRVGYSPNGTEVDNGRCPEPLPQSQKGALMSYHSAGDDCAINELLEGRMDLDVVLPDGRKVKLTVERRTPMMDLLVQAASATKISPAGHTIHVFGDDGGTLPYKPSTPIGSLDANAICIVSKKDSLDSRRNRAPARPFEPTFRVQVHLPRNQLTVVRVSPRSKISELRDMVCREKGLDTSKYQLVRPTSRGQALDGAMTLSEYGATEIALLSNSCIESHICNSTSHIIPYSKRVEEQKKKTGILRLLAEDSHHKAQKKEPSPSPPKTSSTAPPQPLPCRYKPKKRRPAPPPPDPVPFHSRQSSSDSSGYHEATSSSLLHQQHHEENSKEEKASSDSSGVSSLDAKVAEVKAAGMKKRKAPPPPPKEDHVNESEELAPHVANPVPSLENQKADSPLPTDECTEESSEVTRVALAALCARLEQDVTQREIACSIQAAFHSLDGSDQRPSLLAIKQRSSSDLPESKADAASIGDVTGVVHRPAEEETVAKQATVGQINDKAPTQAAKKATEETVVPQAAVAKQTTVGRASPTLAVKQAAGETVVVPQLKAGYSVAKQTSETPSLAGGVDSEKTVVPQHKTGYSVSKQTDVRQVADKTPQLVGSSTEKSVAPQLTDKVSNGSCIAKQTTVREVTGSSGKLVKDKTVLGRATDKAPTSVGVSSSAKQAVLRQVTDNLIETACVAPPTVVSNELSARPRDQNLDNSKSVPKKTVVPVTKQPTVQHHHPNDRTEKTTNRPLENKNSTKPSTLQNSSNFITSKGRSFPAEPPSVHTTGTAKLTRRPSKPEPSRESNGRHVILSTDVPLNGRKVETSSYPLQKSTARLNFDSDDDDPLQSFPLPPSQFRNNPDRVVTDDPIPCPPNFRSTTPLRRSSSLLNLSGCDDSPAPTTNKKPRSRHLQRSLSDLSTPGDDPSAEFEAEQQRLQREYLKLQRHFVLWQQQLLSNHAMLRDECIVPQYARTLRQSHSLPEGGDDDRTPLVSRSLSYEPSTLPRSAINIPPLEFGSGTISNGSNTLRSSKTKSYFKPPQVRVSTKNRQRLPPEIRKDGDMDLYDDTKILSTILPSFDSLKLISEDSDLDIGNLILKPTGKVEKKTSATTDVQKPSFFNNIESKKVSNNNNKVGTQESLKKVPNNNYVYEGSLKKGPNNNIFLEGSLKKATNYNTEGSLKKVPPPVPNKTSSLPKVDAMTRINNERNRDPENVPSNGVPPPPPPPVVEKVSNGVAKVNGVSSKRVEKKVFTPQVDPREQLMQEIRKCGGRTALRKISLDIPS